MTIDTDRPAVELDRPPLDETGAPMDASRIAAALCPYLATPSGHWRSAFPIREHRCTAVSPPVPLAPEKQRRLCLVPAHDTCATYLAANLARSATLPAGSAIGAILAGAGRRRGPATGHRPLARTTPILLERPRPGLPISDAASRAGGQVALIALLVLAFAAIALARLGSGGAPATAPAVSPSLSALPSPVATVAPTPSASPTFSSSPSASARPSQKASPTPRASSVTYKTYTVRSGDSLSSIARQFGVSPAALQKLTGIRNPSLLHPGQVLRIP
jgi:LysM repeat protein